MNRIEKLNEILKKTNISKVNLAKYLNVSRQMLYNYLDCDDLNKLPKEKKNLILSLLEIETIEQIDDIVIDDEYIEKIENKFSYNKKSGVRSDNIIELSSFKKEEQDVLNDIFFILKEILNEDKTRNSYINLRYVYHFLQAMSNTREIKYILGYVAKAAGFVNATTYDFDQEHQFIFESIMYSAMTLYANGGASRTKLAESHKRWETELEQKNEEKLSRTQELNTAKVMALKELGYTEINEKNAGEVLDKIAEIQTRKIV